MNNKPSNWQKHDEKLAGELVVLLKERQGRAMCDKALQAYHPRDLSLGRIRHGRQVLLRQGKIVKVDSGCTCNRKNTYQLA